MKLCKDCRYFSGILICSSPKNGISHITGEPAPKFAAAQRAELVGKALDDDRRCGPEAKHFMPKPEPKRPWWRALLALL